ncbi:MAG: site-specific DNA-methyltransferase, partial [Synergistaceae bacterium]|nr:site-specific DNA-methyltransferase [Synergistaceae bacterium]
MPGKNSREREIEAYLHNEEMRKNNPRVGLAAHDNSSNEIKKYEFDVHFSPNLQWAGKKENSSFDVPVSSIHIHETVIPQRVISRLQNITPDTVSRQGYLFPDANPFQRLQEKTKAIEAYKHLDKWKNRLIAGDSLIVMNSLLQKESMAGKVQMAYIDPPYGIKYGSNFQPFVNKRDVKDKSDDDLSAEPETIKAFRDTWELGIHSYLNYLRNRLLLVRELLTDSGSVFVQISDENVHHVREICDEIFGAENFVTMIKFQKVGSQAANLIASTTDYLIWYAKNKEQIKYYQLFVNRKIGSASFDMYNNLELEDGTIIRLTTEQMQKNILNGRKFQLTPLYSDGETNSSTEPLIFEGKKFFPPVGKHWKTTIEGMNRLIDANRISYSGNGIRYKRYIDDFPVMNLDDYWDDTGGATNMKFVVQTSTKVIQRCMLMTTDPNDLVLDITCGSGTTAYVAEQWGRRWITCDTSRVAIAIARQRLLTAVYDYYELKDENRGVSSGFNYKTVPHITLKSIANDEKPNEEILYDQPKIDTKKIRVSGPCTVEALPAPVVFSPDEAANFETDSNEAAKHSDWSEQMKATGINGVHGEKLKFTSIELFSGTKWINAEAYTEEGKRAFISFANEYSLMDTNRVYKAYEEALKFPPVDMIIFAAFQFDPMAVEEIEELKKLNDKIELLQVNMNTDLLTQDLRRKAKTDSLFWFVGQPDIS